MSENPGQEMLQQAWEEYVREATVLGLNVEGVRDDLEPFVAFLLGQIQANESDAVSQYQYALYELVELGWQQFTDTLH